MDISGSEGRDPKEDFDKINKELSTFSPELTTRPQIVVANKCDMIDDGKLEEYKQYFENKGYAFFPIIAPIVEGTEKLVKYVASVLATLPPVKVYEPETIKPVSLSDINDRTFTISVIDGIYDVKAPWLLKIMNTIDPTDSESLGYFQRVLKESGIIDGLKEKGVQNGDTVVIYDVEFTFYD